MTEAIPDPVSDSSPGSCPDLPVPPPARARRRLDWGRAAELLARGDSAEDTARQLGCETQRILRNLRRSRKFRQRIESAHARQRLAAQLRFGLLGDLALRHLQQSPRLDPRLLQWLGDRTGVAIGGDPDGALALRIEAALRPGEVTLPPRGRAAAQPDDDPGVIGPEELARIIGPDD